jgi:hypothetical protein
MASLLAEAAGLDGFLDSVELDRPLLVFTNCLVFLTILHRWGQVDFGPTWNTSNISMSSVRAYRSSGDGPDLPVWPRSKATVTSS